MENISVDKTLLNAAESVGLKVGEALGVEEYPRVVDKIRKEEERRGHSLTVHTLTWFESKEGEAVAMPDCANMFLTWAEYECWKKYAPEFNKTRNQ